MLLAIAMNQKVREVSIYRAIFYLPSILPVFAISFVFVVLLNPGYGLVNWLLQSVGLPSPNWLGDPAYTKFGAGHDRSAGRRAMGAGLPGRPARNPIELTSRRRIGRGGGSAEIQEHHLAADDTGHPVRPDHRPVVSGLQVFTSAYILTGGGTRGGAGPDNSLLTYVYYLYQQHSSSDRWAMPLHFPCDVPGEPDPGRGRLPLGQGWVFYGSEEA